MPNGPCLDPTEALRFIRTLVADAEYAAGEVAVDGTFREIRNVLVKALGEPDGRRTRRLAG